MVADCVSSPGATQWLIAAVDSVGASTRFHRLLWRPGGSRGLRGRIGAGEGNDKRVPVSKQGGEGNDHVDTRSWTGADLPDHSWCCLCVYRADVHTVGKGDLEADQTDPL